MPTTPLTAKKLKELLIEQELKPTNYSGRGMFGHYCVGASLSQYQDPGQYALPPGWRIDNLGLGSILYWPNIEWKDNDDEADGQVPGVEEPPRSGAPEGGAQ